MSSDYRRAIRVSKKQVFGRSAEIATSMSGADTRRDFNGERFYGVEPPDNTCKFAAGRTAGRVAHNLLSYRPMNRTDRSRRARRDLCDALVVVVGIALVPVAARAQPVPPPPPEAYPAPPPTAAPLAPTPVDSPPLPPAPPHVSLMRLSFPTAAARHSFLWSHDQDYREALTRRRLGTALAIAGGGLGLIATMVGAMGSAFSSIGCIQQSECERPGWTRPALWGGLGALGLSLAVGLPMALINHSTVRAIRDRFPVLGASLGPHRAAVQLGLRF